MRLSVTVHCTKPTWTSEEVGTFQSMIVNAWSSCSFSNIRALLAGSNLDELTKYFNRCSSQLLEFLWMAGAKEGVENDDGVTPLRTAIRFKFNQSLKPFKR